MIEGIMPTTAASDQAGRVAYLNATNAAERTAAINTLFPRPKAVPEAVWVQRELEKEMARREEELRLEGLKKLWASREARQERASERVLQRAYEVGRARNQGRGRVPDEFTRDELAYLVDKLETLFHEERCRCNEYYD